MEIDIKDKTKIRLAKSQWAIPNKLLKEDEAEQRERMEDDELIQVFDRVWRSELKNAVQEAEICDVEFVRSKLSRSRKALNFVNSFQEHRTFRLQSHNLEFIAQLDKLSSLKYELTQLWFIPSSDTYPQCILICFPTVEERKRFTELAEKLNWEDTVLGRELIRDFMNKHDDFMNRHS